MIVMQNFPDTGAFTDHFREISLRHLFHIRFFKGFNGRGPGPAREERDLAEEITSLESGKAPPVYP